VALARRCRYRREGRLRGHSGHRGEPIERQPGPRIPGWLADPADRVGLGGCALEPTLHDQHEVAGDAAGSVTDRIAGSWGCSAGRRRRDAPPWPTSRIRCRGLSKFNAVWASNQYQRCFDASHGRCHISSEACCRGRPLLLSSRRSATAVDVAPRFSLLASAISSEARGSARKGKAVGTPLRERGQRPGHDAVRGPSPSRPTGESHTR
jgi:hypothetical protein